MWLTSAGAIVTPAMFWLARQRALLMLDIRHQAAHGFRVSCCADRASGVRSLRMK
ncbi:MAG: hypothetical protein AAFO87_15370 [Cyanobacteria bacterium J06607_6]